MIRNIPVPQSPEGWTLNVEESSDDLDIELTAVCHCMDLNFQ